MGRPTWTPSSYATARTCEDEYWDSFSVLPERASWKRRLRKPSRPSKRETPETNPRARRHQPNNQNVLLMVIAMPWEITLPAELPTNVPLNVPNGVLGLV